MSKDWPAARWLVATALLLCGPWAVVAAAAEIAGGAALVVDADAQFDFARSLFEDGHYERSATEFLRFSHLFPTSPRAREARLMTGRAWLAAGRCRKAADQFRQLTEPPYDRIAWSAFLLLSDSRRRLGDAGGAAIALHNLVAVAEEAEIRDAAFYRLGWLHLEAAEWPKAREYLARIGPAGAGRYRVEALERALQQTGQIPRKDPATAGVLAILPGAGHLYCGRPRDALIAALLNAGVILSAVEAFDHDLVALGSLLSVVGATVYVGNIYSAVNSAHKYNRWQTRRFVENLERTLKVSLSAAPSGEGIGIAVQLSF
jgi:hypothetical protein